MLAKWSKRSRFIVDQLRGVPGLTPEYRMTSQGYANAVLIWDKKVIPIAERDAAEKLRNGDPRIVFTSSKLVHETLPSDARAWVVEGWRRGNRREAAAAVLPTGNGETLDAGVIPANRLRQGFGAKEAGRPVRHGGSRGVRL